MTDQLQPHLPKFPFNGVTGISERSRCLHCLKHNSTCECTDVPVGKDVILESYSIPSLQDDSEMIERLARYLGLSEHHPSLLRPGSIDFHRFFDDNLSNIVRVFPTFSDRVNDMIASGDSKIYSREADQQILKILRKRFGYDKAGPETLRDETYAAAKRLLTGDWSHITNFDTVLINNAFQRSDDEFLGSVDEEQFRLVYDVNDVLAHSFDSWAADWHISLETTAEEVRKQREDSQS